MFLLPNRALRPSSGNVARQVERQPVAQLEHQHRESPTRSATSQQATPEAEGHSEEEAGPSWAHTEADGSEEQPEAPAAAQLSRASPTGPAPPTRTPATRQRARRTLRTMDRQLEVESDAMSFIRRVHGDDEFDYFGYAIASRCRRLPPEVAQDVITYFQAAVAVFEFAAHMPPVEELIGSLNRVAGRREARSQMPHSRFVQNSSTQTEHTNPPPSQSNPSTASHFAQSFYPYPPSQYSTNAYHQSYPTNYPPPSTYDSPPRFTNM
ncbi:uncharacterized protein LOC142745396 [Rhinoderma darwinii]|uniref:uncharacterized protein LOC142745396 n=1 Tax=Rhinoderma darwinii TaxID=43563 RepID=UPI003F66FEF3